MTVAMSGYGALMPLIVAAAGAIAVLVVEMFSSDRHWTAVGWLSVASLVAVILCSQPPGSAAGFAGAVVLDGFASYFNTLLCGLALLAVLMAMDYLPSTEVRAGEYYPLLLFAVAGLLVMAAATDLIILFLGLETMSMAVYVLTGIWRRDLRSNEAALKYFLLGAFASAFLLYGIALLYAETGSTVLSGIAGAASNEPVFLVAIGFLVLGFGFKVAAVPFHLWAPDVYEGAPTSVTVFMVTAVKAGAFAALLRVLLVALARPLAGELDGVVWVAAVATMTVGNFIALRQSSLKRMLAYSSIAHTGYLLVGLSAGSVQGGSAILFYLAAYGAMNLGAFGVMMMLARRGNGAEQIGDLAGLGQSSPLLALAMTVCMLSLTGFPPFAGFVGKLYLFSAALAAGKVALVIIAVLNSVVSAGYYLGVVRAMYFEKGGLEPQAGRPYLAVATAASVALTLLLGISPAAVLDAASQAFQGVLLGP